MPKQQKRRVRSNCWYFYEKTVDGGICNMCKREVRSTGNTTNLLNHLKRRHTVQYNEVLISPEKYSVTLDEESRSDQEDKQADCKHNETENATQVIEETNQSHHSMEAFHADQGGTVIWLQPTVDQQASSFQPQITIVQHSVQENSEGHQAEGETILGTGEIVSHTSLPAIEAGSATSEAHKPCADNHHVHTHRKAQMQNSIGKTSIRPSPKTQVRSFGNPNSIKVVKPDTEMPNHMNREDTYDAFGRYLASLLRNMSSKKAACRLQKDMIWLVLQEQMRNEDS